MGNQKWIEQEEWGCPINSFVFHLLQSNWVYQPPSNRENEPYDIQTGESSNKIKWLSKVEVVEILESI